MTDNQDGFKIVLKCPFSKDDVIIHYEPKNLLAAHHQILKKINQQWTKQSQEASRQEVLFYNDAGYSVFDYRYSKNKLLLHLTDTSYKEYICTFKNPPLLKIINPKIQPKMLSLFGTILTNDNYFVFGESSGSTRSGKKICAPGGMVKKCQDKIINSKYLFSEFKRELSEETGINPSAVKNTKLLGITIKENTANTPRLVFFGQTNLTSKQIQKMFKKADKEFQRLVFVKNSFEDLANLEKRPRANWTISVFKQLYFR